MFLVWCAAITEEGTAQAMGEESRLQIGHLVYKGESSSRPTALRRLLWAVQKRTSVKVALKSKRLRMGQAKLLRYPLLYLSGGQAFPPWKEEHIRRLRTHLTAGGTLFVDLAEGKPGGGFDRSVRRLARRLFPRIPLKKLGRKHTLYKSFYLIRRFGGRMLQRPYLEGITRDDRTLLLYSMNDLGGAWERDNFGNWTHAVVPGGSSQREHAFRLGVNIVMYALCVNYKRDLVHVPFIMNRRK